MKQPEDPVELLLELQIKMYAVACAILLLVILFQACATIPVDTTLPMEGCLYGNYEGNNTYERVVVMSEYSVTEWNVWYRDSNTITLYPVSKRLVRFVDCPAVNELTAERIR